MNSHNNTEVGACWCNIRYWKVDESSGFGVPTIVTTPFLISGHCVFSAVEGDALARITCNELWAHVGKVRDAAPGEMSETQELLGSAGESEGHVSVSQLSSLEILVHFLWCC